MELGEFHDKDGWYFKRLPDGSVRIRKTTEGAPDVVHTIAPGPWVSVVAHLAAGDDGVAYSVIEKLHNG